MKLSVILPTYNEAANIVELINAIIEHIPEPWEPEIIVADDNSPDGTLHAVQQAFPSDPRIVTILRTKDRGLARSIRDGLLLATGEQVLVMDTDFTHDPVEIPRLLHVAQIYDVVTGSRFCAGGNMEDTSHYLASLCYNWCMRLILRTQIQDNLGGYFTIRREALEVLPYDEIFYGYGDYYFRLLHFAEKQGYTLVELPAQYLTRRKGASKSNFFRLLLSYTTAVVKFRFRVARKLRAQPRRVPKPIQMSDRAAVFARDTETSVATKSSEQS